MAIITKPVSIEKNSPAEISLNKVDLAAKVELMSPSSYYANSTNWKEVFIYYKSSVGNQREILKFDSSLSIPVTNFLVSDKARDVFQVQKIVIVDFDNGSFLIPRSQLVTSDFDIDMTSSPLNNIIWNFAANPSYSLNPQGQIVSTRTAVDWSPESLLPSTSSYAIGSGLEYKLKVDNGFFPNTISSQYLGARITESGVYGGYTRDYAINQYGVQNNHNNTYPYPISAEIEFKMIIKVNETLFYVNNILIATMPPIASGITSSTQITPVIRFNNQYNVKEYSIISL